LNYETCTQPEGRITSHKDITTKLIIDLTHIRLQKSLLSVNDKIFHTQYKHISDAKFSYWCMSWTRNLSQALGSVCILFINVNEKEQGKLISMYIFFLIFEVLVMSKYVKCICSLITVKLNLSLRYSHWQRLGHMQPRYNLMRNLLQVPMCRPLQLPKTSTYHYADFMVP
jgi:hypothetical protein